MLQLPYFITAVRLQSILHDLKIHYTTTKQIISTLKMTNVITVLIDMMVAGR
jgi:fumarate reductase subunit D